MNATKELRSLLDERGVEWCEPTMKPNTTWFPDSFGVNCRVKPWGELLQVKRFGLTPEQAIAATLGDEPKSMRVFDSMETALAIAEKEVEIEKLKRENAELCDENEELAHRRAELEAATLGSGKLTAEQVRKAIFRCGVWDEYSAVISVSRTDMQAIADELNATLGRPKAKSHPYGYEPDTGAFDATRCECGCLNDISATYCNDCGGEIEIDMNAEKEIYHTPRHSVFVEKHDDGSLELGGKRYIAATPGGQTAKLTAEQVMAIAGRHQPDYCSDTHVCFDWQAIADELNAALGDDEKLLDLAHNAWGIAVCAMQGTPIPASWGDAVEKGLRERGIDVDELPYVVPDAALGGMESSADDALALLDEIREADRISYDDYSRLFDAIAVLGGGECKLEIKDNMNESEGTGAVWWECSSCHWQIEFFHTKWLEHAKFCPECGARI